MAKNSNLAAARSAKNDEFYTRFEDIQRELVHYRDFFKGGKTVYCNCDGKESNFFKYFALNFEFFGLKKLICTSYNAGGKGLMTVYEGDKNGNLFVDLDEIEEIEMQGDGDFRSEECIEILKEADVVVTNPPFSLFRDYVALMEKYNKKYLVIGNKNAVTYKEIFPLIKENKLWFGTSMQCGGKFILPDSETGFTSASYKREGGKNIVTICGAHWFTNIEHKKRTEWLDLYKKYKESEFPKYDNYDAIEVSKTCDIPYDYDGVMGVPITFLDKYCPEQFEILWLASGHSKTSMPVVVRDMVHPNFEMKSNQNTTGYGIVDGKQMYHRILIRAKK